MVSVDKEGSSGWGDVVSRVQIFRDVATAPAQPGSSRLEVAPPLAHSPPQLGQEGHPLHPVCALLHSLCGSCVTPHNVAGRAAPYLPRPAPPLAASTDSEGNARANGAGRSPLLRESWQASGKET
uniref:Uncharacterized protein n=1 Tax=Eutreptiella gymnastica TaxID=73025 RepID=A0A7S4GGU7_9EUGL|mmetsp:Transcript_64512/g.106822  ORF Transcript_64512/g.106822 Transcript_64512/m.106822 type:complete len:125 (+) Transcript_64512:285-659(+)|eukprot:CAMPEP_0174332174 /NCGR_PEP_ID=MMETSP0810-20121108/18098_1 /TAXON_ID=73025 ORGANISM="Eutreptiella gymnastica-like, Strain CCMP1594" /NCGR_SAMPLE_ID=MMETSP0810 /ASSEMBLY_ACC=CAM_ASM_000659 /LENGTH=124 /DNA_ID=CAMNT_0015448447 /DNA_START=381 /DNA_END=755 /DNA_ORIENTATION=-